MKYLNKIAPNVLVSSVYILFALVYFFKAPNIIGDPDIGWHLKAGEIIRSLGFIPETDPWAFTSSGEKWLNISWLFDVIISYINDFLGIEGLIAVFAFAGALVTGFICRICLKRGAYIIPTAFVMTLTGILFTMGVIIRPQIITFILTVFFYEILRRTNERRNIKKLLLLPLAMLLWVNVHGGFILGFLFLGAYGLEAIIEKRWVRLKELVIISGVCIITVFINPLGWELIPAILRTLNSEMGKYIIEWRPVKILSDTLITAHLIFFIIALNRTKKISLAENLIAIGLLLLGLHQIRNYEVFVLISAPYIAINLSEWFKKSLLEKEAEIQQDFSSSKGRIGVFITACFITVFLCLPSTRSLIIPEERFGCQKDEIPFKAMEFIEENYPDTKFYNRYRYGGYLIYFTDIKVFIDGRVETAYPKEFIKDYINILKTKPGWQEVLNKYEVEGIFLPKIDSRLKYFKNSPDWQKVFEDDISVVYIKNDIIKK